jgi:hypothetical protein
VDWPHYPKPFLLVWTVALFSVQALCFQFFPLVLLSEPPGTRHHRSKRNINHPSPAYLATRCVTPSRRSLVNRFICHRRCPTSPRLRQGPAGEIRPLDLLDCHLNRSAPHPWIMLPTRLLSNRCLTCHLLNPPICHSALCDDHKPKPRPSLPMIICGESWHDAKLPSQII